MRRALSRSQAAELLRAAGLLPLATRDQFISEVDSRLCDVRRQLTDADVSAAIVGTLTALDVTTSPHLMCDAQQESTMAIQRDYEVFETATGRPVADDDDVLRPGQTLRTTMMLRDGRSEVQSDLKTLSVAEDAAKRFGLNDALDLHKPGQRFSVDAAARERVEQARAEGIREMCDAWRNPTAARGQQPGDQCTINGQAGHLNHRLECIPDKPERQDAVPRSMTADAAQKIKDEAWLQSVKDLEQAWRR